MKIQKDIRINPNQQNTEQYDIIATVEKQEKTNIFIADSNNICVDTIEPDIKAEDELQEEIDNIFDAADEAMAKEASKLSKIHPKLKKLKSRIIWSMLGFFAFCMIIVGYAGYKMYTGLTEAWPIMKEEAINKYNELQEYLLSAPDEQLTIDTYYIKQYFLVLSADEIEELYQVVTDVEQLKNLADNNGDIQNTILDTLPKDKMFEFARIMLAEQKAKELGVVVPPDEITDDEVQKFIEQLQTQENQQPNS